MDYEQIRDTLDGLHAYDAGAFSSGIRDEALKGRVTSHVRSLPDDQQRALLARITVDLYLSPEAVEQGYGPADVREFLNWCDDNGIPLDR